MQFWSQQFRPAGLPDVPVFPKELHRLRQASCRACEAEQILSVVVQCIDDEPEHIQAPPWYAPDVKATFEKLIHLTIKQTKASIKKRVIQALAPEGSVAQRMGVLVGQCFRWTGASNEEIVWSIEMAKETIGERAPQIEMQREHWLMALERNSMAGEIDAEYAKTRDFNVPLIAVASPEPDDPPGAMILVDGWHRILGAVLTGRQEPMMVHLLSREEEQACRIHQMEKV